MRRRRQRTTTPVRKGSSAFTAGALLAPMAFVGLTTLGQVAPGSPIATTITTPTLGTTSAGSAPGGLAVAPTTPEVHDFALASGESRRTAGRSTGLASEAAPLLVRTKPRPVTGYGVVGVTWGRGTAGPLHFEVRTRLSGGDWSEWRHLDAEDEPDRGTAEFAGSRRGTDALVVGDVDEVQVQVESPGGGLPEDLRLSVVDPQPTVSANAGAPTSADASAAGLRTVAATTGGTAAQPEIRSRAAWGANEKMRSGSPSYGTVQAGFVHHTVNANTYTREQVPSIIRGIYAYHTQSRGWSDIGYNFLVDRFGQIWEGRYGGITRPVIGAHTLGYNHVAFAASAIGNFDVAEPPPAVADAYARLFAWKLDLHGVPAQGTVTLAGSRASTINGHRDLGSTACPGRYLYAKIPAIRTGAAAIQAAARADVPDVPAGPEPSRDLGGDGRADLLVRDQETGRLQVLNGQAGPGFAARQPLALPAGRVDLFTGIGDLTGDGLPDLLTRSSLTGLAHVRPGRADGLFSRPLADSETGRLRTMDLVAGAGDLTGDGRPDLVARDATTGRVLLFPGRSGGRLGTKKLLAIAATDLGSLTGAGDLTGDGRPDLLVTAPDGRLLVYPGTAARRVGPPTQVASGWTGRDLTVAGADLTGDGVPDLLARDVRSGRTFIYALQPGGRPGPRFGGWTGWTDLDQLSVLGDPGTGTARLVGRTRAGALVALDSLGRAFFGQPQDAGRRLADGDFAQIVGDWDGDGKADAVTRSVGTGNVGLHRGDGTGLLGSRSRLWAGWTGPGSLVATGDLTGDGQQDVVSTTPSGTLYVHAGSADPGATTSPPGLLARTGLFPTDLVASVGRWDADARHDLVVRRTSDQRLYLLPGRPGATFGAPVLLRGKAAGYDRLLGVGDLDADNRPDLVATRADGTLWLLPGRPDRVAKRRYLGGDMDRFDLLG